VLVRDTREMEEERRQEACTVLAADAVDDEAALGRAGDGAKRRGDIGLEALEEDQVDVACRRLDVGRRRRSGLDLPADLLPLALGLAGLSRWRPGSRPGRARPARQCRRS